MWDNSIRNRQRPDTCMMQRGKYTLDRILAIIRAEDYSSEVREVGKRMTEIGKTSSLVEAQ